MEFLEATQILRLQLAMVMELAQGHRKRDQSLPWASPADAANLGAGKDTMVMS